MGLYSTLSKFTIAGSALLMVAGCSSRKDVAIANKDETIRNQQALLAQEQADREKLAEQNKLLAEQNNELAVNSTRMAKENADRQAAMQQQLVDLQAAMNGIDKRFAQAKPGEGTTDGGNYSVHADGSIHIIVASSVLFDAGKADLKSSSHDMLSKMCSTVKSKWPNNAIRVEGHTDGTPIVHNKDKFKDNMALSIARSRAVYDYMIQSGGLPANRMYTAGYGEHQKLINPEKTAADRAKNRRVEIVIMPSNVKVQKEYTTASAAPKRK